MSILGKRLVVFIWKLICSLFIGAWRASEVALRQEQAPGFKGLWRYAWNVYFTPLTGAIQGAKQHWKKGF